MNGRILAAFALAAAAGAQGFEKELESSVAAAQWDVAKQILDGAAAACTSVSQADCIVKVTFSRAWVDTEHAKVVVDESLRRQLFERARDEYEEVLKQYPSHAETTDNLVLVLQQLGDTPSLVRLLTQLRTTDPKKAAYVARLIADAALVSDNARSAFDGYRESFELNATSTALNGMVAAFSRSPDAARAAILLKATERTSADTDARVRAFQALAQHPEAMPSATWEGAALGWVETLSLNRRLRAVAVDSTFDVERSPVFGALSKRLTQPFLGANPADIRIDESLFFPHPKPTPEDWWTENPRRSQALALAGWSVGYGHLLENDPVAAEQTWLGAVHYAPSPLNYRDSLNGQRAVMLDLLTDLARVDVLMKSKLDPDGQKFAAIERALFESKGLAYEVNDLLAIERHHALLGKMYADLGRFEGNYDNDPRSARFQLTHAVSTAEKLAKEKGVSDPQPALAALLAAGYRCTLPKQTICKAAPTEAAKWYSDAAVGFLDLDALDQASASMAEVKKIAPLTPVQAEIDTIIQTRSALRMTGQLPKSAWLEPGATQLPDDFVARQQFKAYSDSASTAEPQAAVQNAARAQQILQANPSISGTEDVRIKRISSMNAQKP